MKHGFIKVAACTPKIKVADCLHNAEVIKQAITDAAKNNVDLLALPELCLTGYTCGDLFYHGVLQRGALDALRQIAKHTGGRGLDKILVFLGLPLVVGDKIYNVAAAVQGGRVLGFVPKSYLPNYNEFYDKRQFASGKNLSATVVFDGIETPVSTKLLFECAAVGGLKVAAEICEDLWVMSPPSIEHAGAGAVVIVNLSASNELVGKAEYRRALVSGQSARLLCAYVYASAGDGEAVTDVVFGGHNIVAENGRVIAEAKPFSRLAAVGEIDVSMLSSERVKFSNYEYDGAAEYRTVFFELKQKQTELTRDYPKYPFVPSDGGELSSRAELILDMQAHALAKKTESGLKPVIGVSGGLDSTLALLVALRAAELSGRPKTDVIGVTMPCFGTSGRTYESALALLKAAGVDYASVDISHTVASHLNDIKKYHDAEARDITYENAQARERTRVLMDIANSVGGLVVGTGDLSESALGWCTYNGDHMSMYAVNSSVPKTLVKYLVAYEAARIKGEVGKILLDVLNTPISPELLPPKDGEIGQKTEDIIGPYELHDFFLYYFMRFGFSREKILRLASRAFKEDYDAQTVDKWLGVFFKRFFNSQFKRNCFPDGVKIGAVSLSPRGDWRMPSDVGGALWLL
ncbi:MAG: NAD(+) synthase [Clostridiales bacterium]|jgi:NAD+ synthase (glutamine-hydrolysing)|nr:NAD(+) synthase [Clostridiales bacterium]